MSCHKLPQRETLGSRHPIADLFDGMQHQGAPVVHATQLQACNEVGGTTEHLLG